MKGEWEGEGMSVRGKGLIKNWRLSGEFFLGV